MQSTTTKTQPLSQEQLRRVARAHNLTDETYRHIVKVLGRQPTLTEVGIFGVMYSEHCSYASSKVHLKQFPTTGKRLLCKAGEENAGVVKLSDRVAVVFKIESHNHPSAVEPHAGAATGVGGILRDIFTMGARPIALMDSLRFGPLTSARTRFLLNGVVRGIADYGNCLAPDELVTIRNSGHVTTVAIGPYVDGRLGQHQQFREVTPEHPIEILSFDPARRQPRWCRVTGIWRRKTRHMLKVKTTMGRSWTMTPDHPSLIVDDDRLVVTPAEKLKVGDTLPLLARLPRGKSPSMIDLISVFQSYPANIYVRLRKFFNADPKGIRAAFLKLEPKATNRWQYRHRRTMPLPIFLALEKQFGFDRRHVDVFLPSGRSNYISALLPLNKDVARLLGYYLAEGCVSQNGSTYKLIWTFGRTRYDRHYINDVCRILRQLRWRHSVEQRSSTIAITVSSWFLGTLLKEVWHCGDRATTKSVPDLFFRAPRPLRVELLKGLWRGDGSVSIRKTGSRVKVSFATASPFLANQTALLLQDLGVIPLCYARQNQGGQIRGRRLRSGAIHHLELNGYQAVSRVAEWFAPVRNRQIKTALRAYQFPDLRYSFPRHCVKGNLGLVRITEIIHEKYCGPVYDFSVEGTHLFIASGGLITHNCMGVPTVGGELVVDACYAENPLVNVLCVGIVHPNKLARAKARGIGNPVLYVGSSTGRDGLGGASFASREITEASEADRPAVQLGDPFAEKCLLEATLEALATGHVLGIQDMGAAGLTCSTCETASRGGVGMEIDVARVPRRETGMTPYEVMLSESQERMLLVAKKGREQSLARIFQKWGLQSARIGRVTSDGLLRVKDRSRVVAEIPARALTDEAPVYRRPAKRPADLLARQQLDLKRVSEPSDYHATAQRLIASPTIASKEWMFRQYDHMVQMNTVVAPGADAAVLRLKGASLLLAVTADGNGAQCALDPYEGGKLVVAEAARNLVCVGATPLAVTDCLNFGNPEDPKVMWQFTQAVAGVSAACRTFRTPVTGGNVSFYNESHKGPIDPTPVIGMIGVIDGSAFSVRRSAKAAKRDIVKRSTHDAERFSPNAERLTLDERWLTPGFKQEDDWILLLGNGQPSLGGSVYLNVVHGLKRGRPTPVDLTAELALHRCVLSLARRGALNAAHDCSDGGLFVALAEMAFLSPTRCGANVDVTALTDRTARGDVALFGEAPSRIVVTCAPQARRRVEAAAQRAGVSCRALGAVGGAHLQVRPWLDVEVAALDRLWRTALAMHAEGVGAGFKPAPTDANG